jgi:hypothetical protein
VFAKTGSGQTYEELDKTGAFLHAGKEQQVNDKLKAAKMWMR